MLINSQTKQYEGPVHLSYAYLAPEDMTELRRLAKTLDGELSEGTVHYEHKQAIHLIHPANIRIPESFAGASTSTFTLEKRNNLVFVVYQHPEASPDMMEEQQQMDIDPNDVGELVEIPWKDLDINNICNTFHNINKNVNHNNKNNNRFRNNRRSFTHFHIVPDDDIVYVVMTIYFGRHCSKSMERQLKSTLLHRPVPGTAFIFARNGDPKNIITCYRQLLFHQE
ncbi:hypothetical protein SAMD00019534_099020 [Acytostelium subglobosum LB1]|uniref:hypothetical protein n=1 Tax=Acytostelium subglobosum LB1 TaxID=1410327 RepID=UPI000644CDE7|nr:hypothetical protein SAMD00019534_099020 [Acytostelium subglobosum LB1]GAM26727.1 hypothetical protein SAMD00019534_099020 [Acytostelium subglobosum LB1]|eukprot:XP_012750388.1 hypothetical protein SAMD00019534_099020 [Acytostelium subglobosum LB1]